MKNLLAVLLITISFSAHADIFDRINECERVGGGDCIFDLLRELARNNPPQRFIPEAGAYRKTSGSSNLCVDQYIQPVLHSGELTELRVGWCGDTFNKTFTCNGSSCKQNNTTIEFISKNEYIFTNESGDSGVFSR